MGCGGSHFPQRLRCVAEFRHRCVCECVYRPGPRCVIAYVPFTGIVSYLRGELRHELKNNDTLRHTFTFYLNDGECEHCQEQ